MTDRSLNQSAIAEQCNVSREAVSNWLSGQSTPRPLKLKTLAKALGLSVAELVQAREQQPEPVVAYRTQHRVPASMESLKAAEELAYKLRELVPFIFGETFFTPPHLEYPRLDDEYIRKVTAQIRARRNLTQLAPISREHLCDMHHAFGSIFIPVLWSGDRVGHENALSVYLPESKSSWVVLNLNARNDDFNYWLAHELGHCYSLHALRDNDGEIFSERFAQELLFPHEVALEALNTFSTCDNLMAHAEYLAKMYNISIITVIRQIDRVAVERGDAKCGLETEDFWNSWKQNRHLVPTVAQSLFGPDELTSDSYIENSEKYFRTPVFKAISSWQKNEGGRSPAFIAATLNVGLADANEISKTLLKHI